MFERRRDLHSAGKQRSNPSHCEIFIEANMLDRGANIDGPVGLRNEKEIAPFVKNCTSTDVYDGAAPS